MIKELIRAVFNALKQGEISKAEAKELIKSKGEIILNLSSYKRSKNETKLKSIFQKVPSLKNHFLYIIDLGIGVKP